MIVDFLIKYWLEIILGIVVAAGGAGFNYLRKLIKKDQKEKLQSQFDEFYQKINQALDEKFEALEQEDETIDDRLNAIEQSMEPLKQGVLSLHRRKFLDDCRYFLETEEEITLEDFKRVQREHKVYNDLGGNHEGDEHWELFKARYEAQLAK